LSLDQEVQAGVGIGFVGIHGTANVQVNGGIAWVINANAYSLSTWLEWSGALGGSWEITGYFGKHGDVVLAHGEAEGNHEFHKLLAGPEIIRY
jgi:hypothetical protein